MITRIPFRFVILTAMLALCSLALEEEEEYNHITFSFSIWYPAEMDFMIVDEAVINALQDFLSEDIEFILLDGSFFSMLEFIKDTDPDRSSLNDEPTNVIISEDYYPYVDDTTMQRTVWNVNYDVLQIGTIEIENARLSNYTDEILYMEDLIDVGLHVSIMDGIMDQRLEGTGIIMRTVPGNEWQSFSEITLPTEEDVGSTDPGNESQAFSEIILPTEEGVGRIDPGNESHAFSEIILPTDAEEEEDNNIILDPELDLMKPAIILRYIGIVMMVGSISAAIILTYLGKRYRIKKERKELSPPDPEEQRGLVTEQGVNLMLEIGRRESERMSSNTSYAS